MLATFVISAFILAAPAASAVQDKKAPPPPPKPAAAAKPGAARVVEILATDDMKYSITEIAAKPGETLRIKLVSKGTLPKVAMAHNVVVLKPGAKQTEFANAAAMARATDFVPAEMKDQVVAASGLAGPGETVEVTVKIPAAGTYPFICTFPGHFAAGMRGNIVAK
jgi:azurin